MSRHWHIIKDDTGLTVTRQLPVRFDVVAQTVLPKVDPLRLAHQIRQDMWRALQSLRGFSPVVRLSRDGADWRVEAGGRVAGRVPGNAVGLLEDVLDDPARRARWVRFARRGVT